VIAISPVHWRADCCPARSYNIRPIVEYAFRGVSIEPFPGNALIKIQYLPHRKHITSPLQRPTNRNCCLLHAAYGTHNHKCEQKSQYLKGRDGGVYRYICAVMGQTEGALTVSVILRLHGTRKFINVITKACQYPDAMQSTLFHPLSLQPTLGPHAISSFQSSPLKFSIHFCCLP
jgi:hypothetical protein